MRTIEIYKFNYYKLKNTLLTKLNIKNKEMLEKILLFFGNKIENTYIILNNELEFGKSSFYNAAIFINMYFCVKNSFSIFLELSEQIPACRTLEQAKNAINNISKDKEAAIEKY
jgi:hypothetical protein